MLHVHTRAHTHVGDLVIDISASKIHRAKHSAEIFSFTAIVAIKIEASCMIHDYLFVLLQELTSDWVGRLHIQPRLKHFEAKQSVSAK